MMRMKRQDWILLAECVVLCELAGVAGSVFTFPAITGWYATLAKPSFTPPSWVFGPAWTILYALMGAALYLVWREKAHNTENSSEVKPALFVFGLQLALNVLWSVVFFGLRAPGAALFEIILLWISVIASIVFFLRVSRDAALLLVPYFFWVSFAATLNFYVWLLN